MRLHLKFLKPVDEFSVVIDGDEMWLDLPGKRQQVMPVTEVVIEEKQRKPGRPKKASDLHRFDEWYALYPRKVARGGAEQAWRKLNPTDEMVETLIRAVKLQEFRKDDPAFIPHPATWLNGKRWMDEVGSTPTIETPYANKPWGAFIKQGNLAEVLNLMVSVGLDDADEVGSRFQEDTLEAVCDWLWQFKGVGV